jgi:hypothetical protein
MGNRSRIMGIERPLWHESQLKMLRQQLCQSSKMWKVRERQDRQLESLSRCLQRYCMQSETVWAIVQALTIRGIGKTRQTINITQSWASWPKLTYLAGWWAYCPTCYSNAWIDFSSTRLGLSDLCRLDWRMRLYTSGRAIGSTGHSNWSVWRLWSLKLTQL